MPRVARPSNTHKKTQKRSLFPYVTQQTGECSWFVPHSDKSKQKTGYESPSHSKLLSPFPPNGLSPSYNGKIKLRPTPGSGPLSFLPTREAPVPGEGGEGVSETGCFFFSVSKMVPPR